MKPRKAPLQRTPITRKTPMQSTGKKKGGRGPTKPRKPSGEGKARGDVKARSGLRCEIGMCGGVKGTDWSHRKRRSQGGKWCATNGLWACRSCHLLIGEREVEVRAEHFGWIVKSQRDPAEVPVWIHGEWVLLDVDGGMESINPEAIGGDAA